MSEPAIPLVRLDNQAVWEAVSPKLQELVLSGRFTLGPELEEFEGAAAATFGAGWAVGVASGTAALTLPLRAALPPGSRVGIPANTFFATLEAVVLAGHRPVVLDHDGARFHYSGITVRPRPTCTRWSGPPSDSTTSKPWC